MRRAAMAAVAAAAVMFGLEAEAQRGAQRRAPRRSAAQKSAKQPAAGTAIGLMPMVPYRGAIALDAKTGKVLFADGENRPGRPASLTKMMTFLLVLEDVKAGTYALSDVASASGYAASMEPSRVGIKPGDAMTVGDLLYSIMVKSANDAAVVLAEHAAWARSGGKGPVPKEEQGLLKARERVGAFVARMNRRAAELGMGSTRYESPNGLPPQKGEKRGYDTSTARDQAVLARKIARMKGALEYTREPAKTVAVGSNGPLRLASHNYFLPGTRDKDGYARPVEGCDGIKTGYTRVSGSSIALTAERNGGRVVVVVLGSAGRLAREAAAGAILRDALGAVSFW